MNGRTLARIFLAVVIIAGAVGLGVTAYNAGVTAGLAETGRVVVNDGPYLAPGGSYVGYGLGHGFGFFGGLLFLILLFALVRAAFGGRRGWGRHGSSWVAGGWRDEQGRSWEERARDAHDAWHRDHPEGSARNDPPAGA
jgi:hypothetical protein